MKYDDFFETVQETKAFPHSKWQQLAQFVSETGVPIKEPKRTKKATIMARQTTQSGPRVIPQEDPFVFDFIDPGETDNQPRAQRGDENGEPAQLPPEELPAPGEP
jgi:hypothetical protein